jgi:redox-sensitive bicupin YhaK (pirin superfamily)
MQDVSRVIDGRPRDLGGFSVRRVLPAASRPTVGPFIFFDHMGPARFAPGEGVDVRPHPHIGLATVTYLFAGEFMHRDSLGSAQLIRPGDVNWMVAGSGIAHSERTPPEVRDAPGGSTIHGIQVWIALPAEHEEAAPSFTHHPAASLPEIVRDGARLRLIAGEAFGRRAPAAVFSPMFYLDAALEPGAALALPDGYAERAAYVAEGAIEAGGARHGTGQMVEFAAGRPAELRAAGASRVMLLGGAPLEGTRHLWWNFVSSRRERIDLARADWRDGRFAAVPGDPERIPLPEA